MNSPIESFFALGNKISQGNPVKKAQFDYYLFWILFSAFFYLMVNYFFMFYKSGFENYYQLAWGFVMAVIVWFNYNGLVGMYNSYTNLKKVYAGLKNKEPERELEIESIDKMLGEFK